MGYSGMRRVRLLQPRNITFGPGCIAQCVGDIAALGFHNAFIVTSPPILELVRPLREGLEEAGVRVSVYSEIAKEPSVATYTAAMNVATESEPEVVVGLGGGSAMDVAKLVAALYNRQLDVREAFGIDTLGSRALHLMCLPTTAGSGSEVSPNAILRDERTDTKQVVISPQLVPDAAYVDPLLTVTVPPAVTAATGIDALTNCIEAYANRQSHPTVDLYALQGIRLIGGNLRRAFDRGDDIEARTNLALGSLYGGLCLAPVNTAAVHALGYPLGSAYHVPHGVSIAVLLPHVLRFNLPAAPRRYAEVAIALGVEAGRPPLETAERGVERLADLSEECGIPTGLAALGVAEEAIPGMAEAAMRVTRLLKNNPRELSAPEAEAIYRAAY